MTKEEEVRMAILELRVATLKSILVWTLTPIMAIAGWSFKYAWESKETSVIMNTELAEVKKEINELTEQINLTNLDLTTVQDWADERFQLRPNKK